jgi:hypothetical protein
MVGAPLQTRDGRNITFRYKLVVMVVGFCGIAGIVAHRFFREHCAAISSSPVRYKDESSTAADTRREIAELRGEIAALRLNTAIAAKDRSTAETKDDASPTPHADAPEVRAPTPEDVENAFLAEPVDSRWAPEAEGKVRSALSAAKVRSVVQSTICRSRTCRIEVNNSDPSTATFMQLNYYLVTDFPRAIITRPVNTGDKETPTYYYFTRAPP